jgi:Toprim-like
MCLLLHQRRWWAPTRGNEATPTTLSTILSASTAGCLQAGREPLWVCEGAFDALALLAAGVQRVVAIFGVQGWRWDWVREVRALVFALDADTAGQQQWRRLARQAALRGKRVAVLPPEAYGGHKDVNEAWVAGTLAVGAWSPPAEATGAQLAVPADLHEVWEERVAIMLADGHLLPTDAARLAWEGLQTQREANLAMTSFVLVRS